MSSVTIRTSVDTFVFGHDEAMDLLAHIRESAGPNRDDAESPLAASIDSQGAVDVRWSDEGKHGSLHAIDEWLRVEGTKGMPEGLMDLRYELMRDLRLPPFDEEIPYDET